MATAALAVAGYWTNLARTNGEVRTTIDVMMEVLRNNVGTGQNNKSETIASGVIDPGEPVSCIFANCQTFGVDDDLDQIWNSTGNDFIEGQLLVLSKALTETGDITIKHLTTGSLGGEFKLYNDTDITLENGRDQIVFKLEETSSRWVQLGPVQRGGRSGGGGFTEPEQAAMDMGWSAFISLDPDTYDVDKVDGKHAADFVWRNSAGQIVTSDCAFEDELYIDDPGAATAIQLTLRENATGKKTRVELQWDRTNQQAKLNVLNTAGTVTVAQLRVDPDGTLHFYDGTNTHRLWGGETGAPASDPGWASSSTVDMTPPDDYPTIEINGTAYAIAAWLV